MWNTKPLSARRVLKLITNEFHCQLDLRKFPFDHHNCYIVFESWKYNSEQVELISYHLTVCHLENPYFPYFFDICGWSHILSKYGILVTCDLVSGSSQMGWPSLGVPLWRSIPWNHHQICHWESALRYQESQPENRHWEQLSCCYNNWVSKECGILRLSGYVCFATFQSPWQHNMKSTPNCCQWVSCLFSPFHFDCQRETQQNPVCEIANGHSHTDVCLLSGVPAWCDAGCDVLDHLLDQNVWCGKGTFIQRRWDDVMLQTFWAALNWIVMLLIAGVVWNSHASDHCDILSSVQFHFTSGDAFSEKTCPLSNGDKYFESCFSDKVDRKDWKMNRKPFLYLYFSCSLVVQK